MQINLKIDNDNLILKNEFNPKTGNVNYYEAIFDCSEDWEEMDKYIVFINDGETYTAPIVNNKYTFPDLNKGVLHIGVFATQSSSLKKISTNMITLMLAEGAYRQGETPQTPTLDIWETYIQQIQSIVDSINSDEANRVEAENERETKFNNIHVNATTLAEGSEATSDVNITSDSIDISLGIPKGDTGATGDKGDKGDTFTYADMTNENKQDLMDIAYPLFCPKASATSTNGNILIPDGKSNTNLIDWKITGSEGGVGDLNTTTGKYDIPITVRGKNIVDYRNVTIYNQMGQGNGIEFIDDGFIWTGNFYFKFPVSIPANTVFSISYSGSHYYFQAVFDDDTESNNIWVFTEITFPKDVKQLMVYKSNPGPRTTQTIKNLQVELGSTITPYERYVAPQEITIELDTPLTASDIASKETTGIDIPLVTDGTNIIEFNEIVKPSSININYYQDINCVVKNLQQAILNNTALITES